MWVGLVDRPPPRIGACHLRQAMEATRAGVGTHDALDECAGTVAEAVQGGGGGGGPKKARVKCSFHVARSAL